MLAVSSTVLTVAARRAVSVGAVRQGLVLPANLSAARLSARRCLGSQAIPAHACARMAARRSTTAISVGAGARVRTLTTASASIAKGDAVTVHYTAFDKDGKAFETSTGSTPLQFIVGDGEPRVPGLFSAVIGLSTGGKKKVSLTAAEAYGDADPAALIKVPRGMAPDVKQGDKVRLSDGRSAVIASANDKEIVVDANHPLAGQPISLEVEVVDHTPQSAYQRAGFAMGCYWGPELHFQRVAGVVATSVGFCNGKDNIQNPSYEAVCSGQTGYAEVVEVFYDPKRASFDDLMAVFWDKHDPTQVNRQGNDTGTQYRSGVYPTTKEQMEAALKSKEEAQKRFSKPIASEFAMMKGYARGPEDHQQYLARGGRFGRAQSPAKMCTDPVRCYG